MLLSDPNVPAPHPKGGMNAIVKFCLSWFDPSVIRAKIVQVGRGGGILGHDENSDNDDDNAAEKIITLPVLLWRTVDLVLVLHHEGSAPSLP